LCLIIASLFIALSKWIIFDTPHFKKENENAMVNELLAAGVEMIICGVIPYCLEKN